MLSLISIFLSFEKIIFKTLLNQEILSIFNKLLYFLKIILISLVLIIFVGGINLKYIGIIAKPLDLLLTYRLSINSSLFYAFDYVDVEKVNPRLLPNREFQLSEKLKRLINDQELKKKRIEHLSDLYDTEIINNKVLTKNFHNSFMYWLHS